MTTRKRLIIYGGTAVVSELAAVTLALVANLTRQFDNGPLHSLSTRRTTRSARRADAPWRLSR